MSNFTIKLDRMLDGKTIDELLNPAADLHVQKNTAKLTSQQQNAVNKAKVKNSDQDSAMPRGGQAQQTAQMTKSQQMPIDAETAEFERSAADMDKKLAEINKKMAGGSFEMGDLSQLKQLLTARQAIRAKSAR